MWDEAFRFDAEEESRRLRVTLHKTEKEVDFLCLLAFFEWLRATNIDCYKTKKKESIPNVLTSLASFQGPANTVFRPRTFTLKVVYWGRLSITTEVLKTANARHSLSEQYCTSYDVTSSLSPNTVHVTCIASHLRANALRFRGTSASTKKEKEWKYNDQRQVGQD